MAADPNPEWLSCLPSSWSYGVKRDGRVFFINEEAKSTTWLHPVSGEAVITGHRKTADLPTGWEEGFTFEGARCFINHNERKVTCKHPVTGSPSQDNCIFVVNEQQLQKAPLEERKEPAQRTMSEASNYTGGSDRTASSTVTSSGSASRPSRSSKKVHNFGKRSNSIKRNPNAPVIKRGWLYKQDSTGMKLWKKRWFVLSDLCLFYYRDDKEEGILGSILLPSFLISLLSVDDHINRKYAFKATHPNMRTYYFCTDAAKDTESWMKVMTDAALVQTEPVRRLEKMQVDQRTTQNNMLNHRILTSPEAQNNERNREAVRREEPGRRDSGRYSLPKGAVETPLVKINSIKLQAAQPTAAQDVTAAPSTPKTPPAVPGPPLTNGPRERALEGPMEETDSGLAPPPAGPGPAPPPDPEPPLQRSGSKQQLEQWVRTQRRQDDETRSILSYQTLPRNMPSHRTPVVARYPEGYRTLPRNVARPDSICSVSPSLYERPPVAEKRRSLRDDTMWQLYEWQQRQAYSRQAPYGTLPSPRTMVNLSEHAGISIPPSPSHGSLAPHRSYSPLRSYTVGSRSEVTSPVFRGDMSLDRRRRPHYNKCGYPPDRRSVPVGMPMQTISPQSLQGKSPEELTLLLIKLRRQQAELNSLREHTLAQLVQLDLDGATPKNEILSHHLQRSLAYLDSQTPTEGYRENSYSYRSEDDINVKLSRLCEQDKVVRMHADKLQQLRREKHTLETALLSASQEMEMNGEDAAAMMGVAQQREVLQSGLLSTCRELSRVGAELDRSWKYYDRLESEVTLAKSSLLEQLEAVRTPQTEPPSQQYVQIQKELWRVQDVMEALNKNKPQRSIDSTDAPNPRPLSSELKGEASAVTGRSSADPWRPAEPPLSAVPQGDEPVPPRPPLPLSYDTGERLPPLRSPGSVQLHVGRHPSLRAADERKATQKNGVNTGPDYRLYKSEPELTTVAEVDETGGEDRSEHAEKEPSNSKGMPFPVGIVPPRTKSPMPESSTIASYVTLRKAKKPSPRTDRPHSAVEHGSVSENARPRMSLEEQLERIKRHQNAALKDRKKDIGVLGQEPSPSPSRSSSFSKENPFRTLPARRREEALSCDIQLLEASLREQDLEKETETPAQEIARLKGDSQQPDTAAPDHESVTSDGSCVEPDPEPTLSQAEEAGKQKKVDRIKALMARNSMQNMILMPAFLKHEDEAESEIAVQEQEKIIDITYELAAEASKLSKLTPVSPPAPSSQPPMADGSHFMCV
ncbi:pleckstrin homology domain-containing family A member 5 isoform X2 [Brienomyrus brachyistius]|uniref:pleckstrin homology domain-containing family A member 5 isoform X2 n=1 Tax=Brienomyrus brachyistius TaxID=42636 RepID=UPI0020B286CE|nr:pleckstrin homology domain-containing family A member 5 isoform X2 [Brienomyrus brachyistius]